MSADTTNPKDLLGVKKAPLRFVPPALVIAVAPAMANGAAKYGAYNWRDKHVKASIYGEAIQRHLYAWMDGEDLAADSGVQHLAHIGACIAILLDAEAHGALIDDRAHGGPAAALLAAQDRTGVSAPVPAPEPTAAESRVLPDDVAITCRCWAWAPETERSTVEAFRPDQHAPWCPNGRRPGSLPLTAQRTWYPGVEPGSWDDFRKAQTDLGGEG